MGRGHGAGCLAVPQAVRAVVIGGGCAAGAGGRHLVKAVVGVLLCAVGELVPVGVIDVVCGRGVCPCPDCLRQAVIEVAGVSNGVGLRPGNTQGNEKGTPL